MIIDGDSDVGEFIAKKDCHYVNIYVCIVNNGECYDGAKEERSFSIQLR